MCVYTYECLSKVLHLVGRYVYPCTLVHDVIGKFLLLHLSHLMKETQKDTGLHSDVYRVLCMSIHTYMSVL